MSTEAFVTLATTDGYALGALVLAQSIRQVGTTRNLVVLISNHLSDLIRQSLETSFDEVVVVEELDSNDTEHLALLARPELGITFTKLNCWLLEQYTKCVFLDSDCLVLKSIDQLFEREQLSAAPDAGWPDCFNSGVFVFQPSKQIFRQLVQFASQQSSSFDGGDQGLLNSFFSDWRTADISRHLPFTYNVTANAFYSYLPAVTRFRNDIHIVHFAGALKPWQLTYNPQNQQLSGNLGGQNDMQRDFLLSWWTVMHQRVWPKMQTINQQKSNDQSLQQSQPSNGSGSTLNYANLTAYPGVPLGSVAHRRAWESGHIDYFGRDSFSNIQQQLEKNIQSNSYQYHPAYSTQTTTTNQSATQLKSVLKQTQNNNQTSQQQTTTSRPNQQQPSSVVNQPKAVPQTQSNQFANGSQQPSSVTNQPKTVPQTSSNQFANGSQQQSSVVNQSKVVPLTSSNQFANGSQQQSSVTNQSKVVPQTSSNQFANGSQQQSSAVNQSKVVPQSSSNQFANGSQQQSSVVNQPKVVPLTQSNQFANGSQQQSSVTNQPKTVPQTSSNQFANGSQQQSSAVNQSKVVPLTSSNQFANGSQQQSSVVSQSKALPQSSSNQFSNGSQNEQVLTQTSRDTVVIQTTASSQLPTVHQTSYSPSAQQQQNLGKQTISADQLRKQANVLNEQQTGIHVTQSTKTEPTVTTVKQTVAQLNPSSSILKTSNGSNENNTSLTSEHQSNWTVKSTITTTYSQGAGELASPTLVSKVVSESNATSSADLPLKSSVKQISDSTNANVLNGQLAKKTSENENWLLNKVFVAITYTISLCYLLFLVAIGRKKNTNIIHGTGSTVRGVTSTSTTKTATATKNGN